MADISKIKLPGNETEYDLKDKSAIANISRSGTTFTATRRDGTTFTFTQQDSDTTYAAATTVSAIATAAITGTSTAYARQDHVHNITADTITSALGYVPGTSGQIDGLIPKTEKGAANGVATLDSNGLVPSNQLPSYVDDVLEYNGTSAFPATGETGKIYVDTSTNLTYRWSGTGYVEISKSLALGETDSTAYPGNKGKANADTIATLKALAFKDNASTSYQPAGTVSQPTFTGTAATISVSKSYTPAGSVTISQPTDGTTISLSSSYTPAGSVTVNTTAATLTSTGAYTPAGTLTVTLPTVSKNVVSSVATASKNVVSSVSTGSINSSTGSNVTAVNASVSGELLTLSAVTASKVTTTATTVVTGVSTAAQTMVTGVTTAAQTMVSGQPSTASFSGTAATISVSGSYTKPNGGSFSGTTATINTTGKIAASFSGTAATITSTGSYTPSGTISTPSFTGTTATITVA